MGELSGNLGKHDGISMLPPKGMAALEALTQLHGEYDAARSLNDEELEAVRAERAKLAERESELMSERNRELARVTDLKQAQNTVVQHEASPGRGAHSIYASVFRAVTKPGMAGLTATHTARVADQTGKSFMDLNKLLQLSEASQPVAVVERFNDGAVNLIIGKTAVGRGLTFTERAPLPAVHVLAPGVRPRLAHVARPAVDVREALVLPVMPKLLFARTLDADHLLTTSRVRPSAFPGLEDAASRLSVMPARIISHDIETFGSADHHGVAQPLRGVIDAENFASREIALGDRSVYGLIERITGELSEQTQESPRAEQLARQLVGRALESK